MCVLVLVCAAASWGAGAEEVFTNAFLVQLNGEHGNEVANEVAKRNGFTNMGPVSNSHTQFQSPLPYLPRTAACK